MVYCKYFPLSLGVRNMLAIVMVAKCYKEDGIFAATKKSDVIRDFLVTETLMAFWSSHNFLMQPH